jgi:hypothetical protein
VFEGRELEPLPPWLREVVETVLPDLQRPRPVDLQLSYERGPGQDGLLWVSEVGAYGATAFWLQPGEKPGAALIVRFADWLQEQVFPETIGAWGEARPECPGHPHPAVPVEFFGEAWWVCPLDGRRIGMLGRLGE